MSANHPKPGDVLQDPKTGEMVMVHFVSHGEVHFGPWNGEESVPMLGKRMPLETYLEAAKSTKALTEAEVLALMARMTK